jgi:CHAT domain-containing protein
MIGRSQRLARTLQRFLALGTVLVVAPAEPAAETPPDRGAYRMHLEAGTFNNNLGRYALAEHDFRAAATVCAALWGETHPRCGDALTRLALEVSNQGRYEEAEIVFERAQSLVAESDSPLDLPRLQSYRAMHLANQRRFDAAFAMMAAANRRREGLVRALVDATGNGETGARARLEHAMADLGHGLFVQAGLAFRLERLEEARVTAHIARRLIRGSGSLPTWWVAGVDELLALIDLKDGRDADAERRLALALETRRLALGNTRAVALSRFTLGSVYSGAERDRAALEAMRPGLAIVRDELDQVPGIDAERLIPFLVSAAKTAARTPQDRPALHAEMLVVAQLARGGAATEAVSRMAARFASRDPAIGALVKQAQDAAEARDRLRLALGRTAISGAGDETLAELRGDYAAAAQRAEALGREVDAVFPEYGRLAAPTPTGVAELAPLLAPDEALVHVLVGADESFGFVVRDGAVKAAPLGIGETEIARLVRLLRRPFETSSATIAPFDAATAHVLYRRLFAPFAEELAGVRHLVVVPSGPLLSLPFGVLVTESPAESTPGAYDRVAWLARDMAVSVMPSLRGFVDLRTLVRPSRAPLPLLGFADPDFAGADEAAGMSALDRFCRTGGAVPAGLLRNLAPLPETATELRRVAAVLGAGDDDLFLGNAAREERLRGLPLDHYRILYFATHGLLPGELRCQGEPGLALTPPASEAESPARDGLLDASEIAVLRLDADLVVLSACNTGGEGGGSFGGESLSGLVRAFFQAGTRSLLVSHWQVNSVATVELMTRLFDALAAGGDTAEALRRAQNALMAQPRTAHPFFWGAFSLIGAGPARPEAAEARTALGKP